MSKTIITARASANQDEIVIEAGVQDGVVLHMRLSLDKSRALREQMDSAEREVGKRQSARGEHPLY